MANYSLFIKPSAVKELTALPRDDRRRIVARVRRLGADPRPAGVEKLSGLARYRVRQGDYRVVYAIDDATKAVTIFTIGHRREVYRDRG